MTVSLVRQAPSVVVIKLESTFKEKMFVLITTKQIKYGHRAKLVTLFQD